MTTKSPRSNQCGGVGNSSGKSSTEFVVGAVVVVVVVDVEFGGGSEGGDGGAPDGAAVAASIVGAGAVAEISFRAGDRAEISSGAWSGPSSRSKTDGVGANPELNSGVATP